jgi:hypothetical protein
MVADQLHHKGGPNAKNSAPHTPVQKNFMPTLYAARCAGDWCMATAAKSKRTNYNARTMSINPYQPPALPDGLREDGQRQGTRGNGQPLTAPDAYGVVVRSFGLLLSAFGLWYVVYAFFSMLNPLRESATQLMYAAWGAVLMGIGVAMMRRADWFVSFAYPQDVDEPNPDDASD